ncbi:phosphoserine phosphatase SerB [Sphingobium sp. BS19]|uniref:phosphoserine phosphatase SerB n=1 Tax=Sphingobium sp. BS19 TaxID=3018973 RepID=UPI0022ED7A62|nr:phosphoserine phosphatase SerB [Sphingobium sp. BS19]GLI98313.1 phosphoserine phosphatase SerB [Sphingobium sp. BS19]
MFVVTLVASEAIGQGDIAEARDRLNAASCAAGEWRWIDQDKAADIFFADNAVAARAALVEIGQGIDVVVQPVASREKKLIVADMDSTMITVECIDELADYAGIKDQIAEITERAMQGELDFAEALRARVALLKGLDDAVIDQCRLERVKIMPGAKALIGTMRSRGARAILVSGGFTRFTGPVAAEIGFDTAFANVLDIVDGKLTGTVCDPIVDAARKRFELGAAMAQHRLPREATLAVGDGANDIPMIEAAGLGVAYHAKAKARAVADAEIVYGDLSVLLYAQGIGRSDWVKLP